MENWWWRNYEQIFDKVPNIFTIAKWIKLKSNDTEQLDE